MSFPPTEARLRQYEPVSMRRPKTQAKAPPANENPTEKTVYYTVPVSFTWDGTAGLRLFLQGARVWADNPAVFEVLEAGGGAGYFRES